MTTYKIVRVYTNNQVPSIYVMGGLTLEEARAHCSDPETSSTTCKLPQNIRRTVLYGAWFDGYDEEK